ncbi:MAG: alginate lyase family protein [Janthinobacterium lividum]
MKKQVLLSPAVADFNLDRRRFLTLAGGAALSQLCMAQSPSLAHVNVAELERSRVLAEARSALLAPISPVTAVPAPHGASGSFYSETEPDLRTAGAASDLALFRAQARALREFSATVACLSAAFLLTADPQYAARAALHLRASLLTPATCLQPEFDRAGCAPGTSTGTPSGVVDLVPLAELARALVFLLDSPALTDEEWEAIRAWFKAANSWLNSNHVALIARDRKDHRGSAWLLLASAFARFNQDDSALEACRKRFRTPTLRNQARSDGVFPEELATPNPYRNTLFNFDLLAGSCQLLSSPFDQLWSYELIDGVGMRSISAYLYPLIAHPERWESIADAVDFRSLPGRRAGLLFAGRAFDRPEYVELWQRLPVVADTRELAASVPIREPLLWTARASHGL